MATVLIGADLCPIEGNRPYFEKGDALSLFHDLLPLLAEADLVIANLECPLIERHTPIIKTGPVFGESGACLNGIKSASIDVLNLANNHIMDHGATGLKSTLDLCARVGFSTVGAGENLGAARHILIKDINGFRIGILAMAEQEFSIAGKNSSGANPINLVDFVRNTTAHKNSYDYLVVLLHGGDEFLVPTPRLKDTCHFLVEQGANAVIVQHPHVLGGYEKYRGAHIVYGQGAFIMDEAIYRNLKLFHEGFLVKLSIADAANSTMHIIPFVQSDPVPGARRMTKDQEKQFREALQARSQTILDDAFVEAEWLKYCEVYKHDYISCLLGHNRILGKLNKRGLVQRYLYNKENLLRAKNMVCCETHREAIETIFAREML